MIELAKAGRRGFGPRRSSSSGGHSASFIARDLARSRRRSDRLRAQGRRRSVGGAAARSGRRARPAGLARGARASIAPEGKGPPPSFVKNLDDLAAARDLLRHRRKYFIGVLDPCASIEFSRGCPWDCSFCSAWTFYGRSYRVKSPEAAVAELAQIREPGVFIVDDVAFIQAEHGMAIGEAIARRGIKKQYYLETRGDVLLRNKDVFRFWKKLGPSVHVPGRRGDRRRRAQAIPQAGERVQEPGGARICPVAGRDGRDQHHRRPDWDRRQFEVIREWCLEIPEIVNISVNTPYPGTETWLTESRRLTTRDYRLFDIQHAVLPTQLPLAEFYQELVSTQAVLNRKHLGWSAVKSLAGILAGNLARGQTNTLKMLWKFNSVYNPQLQLADHQQPVRYELAPPPQATELIDPKSIYIHPPGHRTAVCSTRPPSRSSTRRGCEGRAHGMSSRTAAVATWSQSHAFKTSTIGFSCQCSGSSSIGSSPSVARGHVRLRGRIVAAWAECWRLARPVLADP